RLLLADAHSLPFQNDLFDRVFHVGAINAYRDPTRALHEMARVARAGTPIVVVDEQLDPGRDHTLCHRMAFHALTLFDTHAQDPKLLVPEEYRPSAEVTPVSRFYYCLTFTKPVAPRAHTSTAEGSRSDGRSKRPHKNPARKRNRRAGKAVRSRPHR